MRPLSFTKQYNVDHLKFLQKYPIVLRLKAHISDGKLVCVFVFGRTWSLRNPLACTARKTLAAGDYDASVLLIWYTTI